MSSPTFHQYRPRARLGLKGPRAAQWLAAQHLALPEKPNTWTESGAPSVADDALLLARLGVNEFFLEQGGVAAAGGGASSGGGSGDGGASSGGGSTGGGLLERLAPALHGPVAGVYPVLREDAAFVLAGDGALDVLAQVCNVDFAALDLQLRPLIMTLLIGIAVLIVPQPQGAEPRYRIWCDPTFGPYLEESVGKVVVDCGGGIGERK